MGAEQTPAAAGSVDVGGRVVQVAVGGSHTCALLADGQVRCWGSGVAGRLGYGDTNDVGAEQTPAAAGSVDERGCTLFACGDGQSVATRAVCDGFLHCDNEQDEAMNCPTFACASGSVVPEPFRCDTEADCDDGSDEAGCPQSAMFTCGG